MLFAPGQVFARQSAWIDAARVFDEAITCAEAAQRTAAARLDEIANALLDEARRARMAVCVRQTQSAERARDLLSRLY